MKTTVTLLAILLLGYVSAQQTTDKKMVAHMKEVQKSKDKHSVVWDMDTVFVSGEPYCIIIKERNSSLEPYSFSIRSLQNGELIYVTHTIVSGPPEQTPQEVASGVAINLTHVGTVEYYTWCFTDSLKKAETSTDTKVYKTLVENHLIEGNHLNKPAEAAFIALNGMQFSHDTASDSATWRQTNNAVPKDTTTQNKASGVLILNRTVSRNYIVVGVVKIRAVNEVGTVTKIMSVYLPNGKVIAEGKAYGINSTIWKVVTLKDNRFATVTSNFDNDAIDVMKYLAGEKYL